MPQPDFTPARTIDEVIARLQNILDAAIQENSADGIFPALYLVVTEKVKEGIERGDVFQDNDRMEKLDVIFANRYLEAYENHRAGRKTTRSWSLAFQANARFRRLLILQLLLLGINAHINLDLGIAAAETAPGLDIDDLEQDFNTINAILASLIDGVKRDLVKLSPRFGGFLRFFQGKEDALLNFSLRKAREAAWKFARELAPADANERKKHIRRRDRATVAIGTLVRFPAPLIRILIWWLKLREEKSIPVIVNELRVIGQANARFK
ncbi:MAG: DUF5995 family protein [Bacteroidota bacterium]